jgi:Immunity protein 51
MGILDWLRLDPSTRGGRRDSTEPMSIMKIDGEHSLTFYCGELPVDDEIVLAGHEPNGYFWEGIATFLRPDLADRIELDSEGGMFSASGSRRDLMQLRGSLQPMLRDPGSIRALIERAQTQGFEFED